MPDSDTSATDHQDNAKRAAVLIEALPYIQRFRGQIFVIKVGGSAMEAERLVESLLRDVVFLEAVGINPVLVHGGGKDISQGMRDAKLEPTFIGGLRVTDAASIEIVRSVLDEKLNPFIVETLRRFGGRAFGHSGITVFSGKRKGMHTTDTGEEVDLGLVGEVSSLNLDEIYRTLQREEVPVVSPLAQGSEGETLNVNADLAASALAVGLQAHKLIYLSDVRGVLNQPGDNASLISSLNRSLAGDLIGQNIIAGGMLPKVRSAFHALEQGIGKIHMIDGRIPHSLILEIFTDQGIGTEIIL